MASGHEYRANIRTHGCSDQCCKVKILLANPEPSTHGPKQTWRCVTLVSAFGGGADLLCGGTRLLLLTQLRHRPPNLL